MYQSLYEITHRKGTHLSDGIVREVEWRQVLGQRRQRDERHLFQHPRMQNISSGMPPHKYYL
jgi:hypothetical protein